MKFQLKLNVIRSFVLLAVLAGCESPPKRTTGDPNQPIARDEQAYDMAFFKDDVTGCEYVAGVSYSGLTPRMEVVGDDYRQRGCIDSRPELRGKVE